ncbi:DUF2089 domain-containing protein [Coprothermobacteraceae bacterium]|nr:DUF2089 domain-containing protein [Coprothermobacteraceae bacterium]
MINKCPNCGGKLHITALRCPNCGTGITGDFEQDELMRLSSEQLAFVKLFLKKRGNLAEVQRELNLSYPTVRSRLDDILRTLGYDTEEQPTDWDVIEQLKRGELDPQTAIHLLKEMKRHEST